MKRMLLALLACLGLVLGVVASASAAPQPAPVDHSADYYLALGDSLAAGYQPGVGDDKAGGYVGHVLFTLRHTTTPQARQINLSCSGETTGTMMAGGICSYAAGSQLAQALQFLGAHHGHTRLVTIDIGANDVDGCVTGGTIDVACVYAGLANVTANLPQILKQLRQAAGPDVQIIVLNYYDPFLAAALTGPAGQAAAQQSLVLSDILNFNIGVSARKVDADLANIAAAFSSHSTDLTSLPGIPGVPLNVAAICRRTWMCSLGNIHPNDKGYLTMGVNIDRHLFSQVPPTE